MNAPASLAVLKTALIEAKLAEDAAKRQRIEVEEAILTHFPQRTLEDTQTDKDFGITVSYKVTRTVDTDALKDAWDTLNTNQQKAFKWKADLDLKTFRAIQDLEPVLFEKVLQFVTTKPAKPSVTLKD